MFRFFNIILVGSALYIAAGQASAATPTAENRRTAALLAAADDNETQLSILTGDASLQKALGEPLQSLGPKLISFETRVADEILSNLDDNELSLLRGYFSSKEGKAFLRKQDIVAADMAPILGKEMLRVIFQAEIFAAKPAEAAPITSERSLAVDTLRPLVHSLFEQSFVEYKEAVLTHLTKKGQVELDKALRRFNLSALENAYMESLKRRLTDDEARQASKFFADPKALLAYQKCARLRRDAMCRFIRSF